MEENFIKNFREALDADESKEIKLTDKFRDYDEWDSIRYLSVIAMIDTEYNVIIETPDFRKIETVGGILDEIKKRMS